MPPLLDQQIVVAVDGAADLPGAVEILAQPVDPDPPLDQPEHVGAGVVGLEHEAREVDESARPSSVCHGGLAALALLALALRRPVSSAERPVEHLHRVVSRTLERLGAEATSTG